MCHFKELWLKSPPKDAVGTTLHDFLQGVSSPSNQTSIPKDLNRQVKIRLFTDFFHNSDEFRSTYEQRYHRAPFTNKVTRWRW